MPAVAGAGVRKPAGKEPAEGGAVAEAMAARVLLISRAREQAVENVAAVAHGSCWHKCVVEHVGFGGRDRVQSGRTLNGSNRRSWTHFDS